MLPSIFLSLVATELLTLLSAANNNSVVSAVTFSNQISNELVYSGVCVLTVGINGSFEADRREVVVKREVSLCKVEKTLGSYKNVRLDIKCDRNTFIACQNIYLCSCNMKPKDILSQDIEMSSQPDSACCLLNQSSVALKIRAPNTKLNTTVSVPFDNFSYCRENSLKLVVFIYSRVIQRLTGLKDGDVIECCLDIHNFECWPNIDVDVLTVILTQTKIQSYVMSDKEMILVIKFVLIILVTSFVEKWIILILFLRYTEFRSDHTLIILNLTIANFVSLIFGSVILIFFYTRRHSYLSNASTSVFILVWCVTTLISVHFVTKLSTKRYFSLLSKENCMGQFWQYRRKLATIAVYALWILSCISHVPVISAYTANVYQLVKMLALLNCAAKSLLLLIGVTSYKVARSRQRRRRRRRALWASEDTNQDIMKSNSSENIKFIFTLIIIFMTNYIPVYILDVYGEESSIFKQMSLERASIISYLVIIINNFLNPIMIYGISSTFKIAFRKLYFVNTKSSQVNII